MTCRPGSATSPVPDGPQHAADRDGDAIPELDTRGELTRLREELSDHLTYQATPGWLHEWEKIEHQARTLLSWQPLLIPGLLQTEEYAHEVLQRGQPDKPDAEIDQQVQARLERQQILEGDNSPMLIAVIDEGALRRPIGSPKVMFDQLARLLQWATRPKIVIQVVPTDAGPHPGTAGPMVLASSDGRPDVAYLDTALEGQLVERHEDDGAGPRMGRPRRDRSRRSRPCQSMPAHAGSFAGAAPVSGGTRGRPARPARVHQRGRRPGDAAPPWLLPRGVPGAVADRPPGTGGLAKPSNRRHAR